MGCKKEKKRICAIYDGSAGYSIGTIESFASTPTQGTYNYFYEVDVNSYNGKEKNYGIGQKDETLIVKRFIVVYAQDNPLNCDLNTTILTESDLDF